MVASPAAVPVEEVEKAGRYIGFFQKILKEGHITSNM